MNSFSTTDLFRALDGRRVSVSSRYWDVEIYGVFEQEDACWVQMALRGASNHSVAVKVDSHETDLEVLDALSAWLAHPSEGGPVVEFG